MDVWFAENGIKHKMIRKTQGTLGKKLPCWCGWCSKAIELGGKGDSSWLAQQHAEGEKHLKKMSATLAPKPREALITFVENGPWIVRRSGTKQSPRPPL